VRGEYQGARDKGSHLGDFLVFFLRKVVWCCNFLIWLVFAASILTDVVRVRHNGTISIQIENVGEIMATKAERKETRLVARTSPEIQEIIQRAADYSGATLSQFLIESAMEKARNVIERTETLHLSMAGAEALFATLENPPKANTKLLKAAQLYKDTV
jgi:uncharacterized protein (DUF1778 family)